MNPTAADIIAAARMAVHNKLPYLSHALFALRPHPAPGLGTLAVDAGWRLFYDPETVVQWHKEHEESGGKAHSGLAAVVFHELGHVLRQHSMRLKDKDRQAANIAFDREINDDMTAVSFKLPCTPCLPSDIGMADGLTAEEYYREEDAEQEGAVVILIPGAGGKCGGCAGNPTEWEKQNSEGGAAGPGQPGGFAPAGGGASPGQDMPAPVDPISQEVTLRRVAAAIQEHVRIRGKGNMPAGLQAWADQKLRPPKVDWRRRLRALTRQSLAAVAGASDWTWKRPGRRSLYAASRSGWPLAPALHQPVPKVGIVLDTSGSMSCGSGEEGRTCEDDALSEVAGIARAAGADVWAVACDASAYDVVRIGSNQDLEKLNRGGGGTDMKPGFAAMAKKGCDLVVIVTDGIVGSDWPSQEDCVGRRVLAVLVGPCEHPPDYIPCVEAKP